MAHHRLVIILILIFSLAALIMVSIAYILELYLGSGLGIWITIGCFALIYFIIPILFHYFPTVQRHSIFMNRCQWSFGENYFEPIKHGIKGGRNFYLLPEPGVSIGVWHILPKSSLSEDSTSDSDTLLRNSKYPVIIYLHGNMGSRATGHRMDLYRLLQDNNFHVVAFDYREFGDSTSITPSTETGLVNDSIAVYEWVREMLDKSEVPVYFWGHSLGTGVSVHLTAKLCNEKKIPLPTGLILEAPFTSMGAAALETVTTLIYRPLPKKHWIFVSPLKSSDLAFESDVHISSVEVPILILHDKLDIVVPYEQGRKLYEIASTVSPDSVFMKTFTGNSRSSAHVFMWKEPELINSIKEFMTSCLKKKSKR